MILCVLGNIIIYRPNEEDEGLYQCVASNVEGVVFSQVVKVRQHKYEKKETAKRGRSLIAGEAVKVYLPINVADVESGSSDNLYVVMGIKEEDR